ncbi:hypothetical protein ACFQZT_19030 [Paenibacillus sp. GCM10027628]|uniref:hypothetical protein n=1 Tax=Paenibacillus sp. GCM10027628 TaxID=3273413 RepID=UPI00362ECF33
MSVKTGQELQEVLKKASQSVREKAKSTGAPLYYLRNGKRIREDANGKKYALVIDSEGNLLEFDME